MDRKGGMDIPALVASVTDLFSGVVKIGNAVKFSEKAMNSFKGSAHRKVVVGELCEGLGDVAVRVGHEVFLLDAFLAVVVMMWVGLWQHTFHLTDGDDRQEPQEKKE